MDKLDNEFNKLKQNISTILMANNSPCTNNNGSVNEQQHQQTQPRQTQPRQTQPRQTQPRQTQPRQTQQTQQTQQPSSNIQIDKKHPKFGIAKCKQYNASKFVCGDRNRHSYFDINDTSSNNCNDPQKSYTLDYTPTTIIQKTFPNLGPSSNGGERCTLPDGKTNGIDDCVTHLNNLRKKYMDNPTPVTLREDKQVCSKNESYYNAVKSHSAFTWCGENAQGGSTGQSCMCALGGFLNECIGKTADECVNASLHGSPLLDPKLSQISYGGDCENDITVNYYYR